MIKHTVPVLVSTTTITNNQNNQRNYFIITTSRPTFTWYHGSYHMLNSTLRYREPRSYLLNSCCDALFVRCVHWIILDSLYHGFILLWYSAVTGRGEGGGRVPQPFFTGKFLLTYRENRGKEDMENGEGKKEKRKDWECKKEGRSS